MGKERTPHCEDCAFRARYDENPRSVAGRIWKWHTGWCPGWKSYINSLPEDRKKELRERYSR